MTATAADPWVGRAIKRKEDPRLIMGRARYIDDINVTGQLWAAFVRSPEAHAKITSIDTSAAKAYQGVHAVFTGHDLDLEAPLPMAWVPPGIEVINPPHWAIAKDEVHCVGDPVALVIGSDRYAVVDAAERVSVEYDPLPVVVDIEKALEDGSDLVHEDLGTNKCHEWSLGGGDIEAGFAAADVIVERRVVNHRTAGAAIEPRGVLADYRAGSLTLTSSTQVPHFLRLFLALQLGISEEKVRAIAPEVGGGFGSKLQIYGEEIALAWASRKLERPIKWVESRTEGMLATHHGRDQVAYVRVGATRDGKITAFHTKILQDLGAYLMLLTPTIPSLGAFVMSGVYDIPAVQTDIVGVFTNKISTDAIRGAGRPEATHMIEVCIDQLADELGMDRLELRRKNFMDPDSFPHETAIGVVYDSGNYPAALDLLLEHFDGDAEKAAAPAGKLRGVGYSTYTEICGLAPSRVTGPVRVRPADRPVGVGDGARAHHRRGHRLHRHLAARAGAGDDDGADRRRPARHRPAERRDHPRRHRDRARRAWAPTARARPRSAASPSPARRPRSPTRRARSWPTSSRRRVDDIELTAGKFSVKGSPDKGMTLGEIAGAAYIPENLPEGMEPGLEELAFYDPENFVFPFGAHACVVDVDPETGNVDVVRYVAVDDCGPAINPKLIDGQVHGGIVHAIGQALFERIHYNEDGQLVTSNFADYALPSAADVPSFELDRTETPSPVNSLGVKGIGEAGHDRRVARDHQRRHRRPAPARRHVLNMPLSPMRIWEEIQEAKS